MQHQADITQKIPLQGISLIFVPNRTLFHVLKSREALFSRKLT